MSEQEKCPKCGATVSKKGSPYFSCGSLYWPGDLFSESEQCLRNQLAAKTAECERLQERVAELERTHNALDDFKRISEHRRGSRHELFIEWVRETQEWCVLRMNAYGEPDVGGSGRELTEAIKNAVEVYDASLQNQKPEAARKASPPGAV